MNRQLYIFSFFFKNCCKFTLFWRDMERNRKENHFFMNFFL